MTIGNAYFGQRDRGEAEVKGLNERRYLRRYLNLVEGALVGLGLDESKIECVCVWGGGRGGVIHKCLLLSLGTQMSYT